MSIYKIMEQICETLLLFVYTVINTNDVWEMASKCLR